MACSSCREEGSNSSWQATGRHSISECHFSLVYRPILVSLPTFSPPLSLFCICCLNSSESRRLSCLRYPSHATPSLRQRKRVKEKGVVGTWGEGVESKQWLASLYIVARQLFLHMTAMSDSGPPFRTKTESWGKERREEQRAAQRWAVNIEKDALLIFRQYEAIYFS